LVGKTLLFDCENLHSVEKGYSWPSKPWLKVGLMVELTDLGFSKDVFSETIVSTYNPDGSINSAPMGLKMKDNQHLFMNIFNTSSTCRNLKLKKHAVVNLTSNIEIFYKSAFKEANIDGKIPTQWFARAAVVEAPKLSSSDGSIEVSIDSMSDDGERTEFSCKVKSISAIRRYPQVYCRAMPLTLEAITHATRVKVFMKASKKQNEVSELIETIKKYAHIVERVAPNSEYTAVLADLLNRIDSWRTRP
jgi:hypothetical protein